MSKAASTPDNTIGTPQGSELLETKLYARPARANLVARPRMIKLLDDGLSASLILVSAPAGFGKTTVLAEWLRNRPDGSCWLSLDAADNDPARFLSYVIAALQKVIPGVSSDLVAPLRSPQPPSAEAVVTSLVNELAPVPDSLILVLDDYHVITSTAVNGAVTFLLENLPPNLHLVICTRSDPPIPIAKLRSRGQVVEIRADELRFTPDEAATFLSQTMGLALSAEQVATLDERTEGWIAGLQMAGLSMRGRDAERVDEFIRAFAGTHRFIMDFMLEEVLARESEEVQAFLLQTAILDRLTGPLCDAVTGALGGQEMLERLERRNLFVVPLGDERIWYRYHHLFSDLLRTQLQKSFGAQSVARLHLRASEWYEQNGSTLEAIHHASLASDFERIERLIEQNYIEMMNRGEMSAIRSWMGELSKELVYRRPWLCLYEACSRAWFGQLEEANLLLNEAEKHIRSEVSAPDTQSMLGYHAYVKSRITAMQGDTRRAIEFCLTARENIAADNLGLQIEVSITLGFEFFLYGDFVNANKTLHETIRSGYIARAINNPVAAYALLARLQVYQGRLHDAYDLLQKAAQLTHEAGGQYLGVSSLVEVGIAALLCEWNDLEAALGRLKGCLDYLPLWGKADDLCLAYTTLSRIQLALGNRTEAAGAIEKAAQLIQTSGVFSEARSAVETTRVKLWLVQGDWSSVDRWAATLEKRFSLHDPFQYEDELAHITQARVFIAQNKLDEAIRLLSCLEESAQSGGRAGRLIEIMILKALGMQAVGDFTEADIAFTKGLALAEPEGYVRVFIDEGEPLRFLIADCRSRIENTSPHLRLYLDRLSAAFDSSTVENQKSKTLATLPSAGLEGSATTRAGVENLVEPLSERECEVLRLMAEGLTNEQIGAKLIIALGTVKAHIHNISGKLGAQNRVHAVARAKELNLL